MEELFGVKVTEKVSTGRDGGSHPGRSADM